MPKYVVKEPLSHDGINYAPGEEVELAEVVAETLLSAGVLEGGEQQSPHFFMADGGKTMVPDEAQTRRQELENLLATQGYTAIKKIGEELGIEKPPSGWAAAIDLILEAESTPEEPSEEEPKTTTSGQGFSV